MEIVYFIVAAFSTIIGSSVGLGGGVIIKPVLETLSDYSLPTVNLLSSSTIFVMSIVTVFYQLKKKDKINLKNTIVVALGSIVVVSYRTKYNGYYSKKGINMGLLVISKI